MEFNKGDIVTAEFLVIDGSHKDDMQVARSSEWELVRRHLNLTKPLRFIAAERKNQKIYFVGPSNYPHCDSLIVEYVEEAGVLRAEHFVISQLENIPEYDL